MKTLRDTATLVALLLLALTVRVDSRDPSAIDLATPAHAATAETQVQELEPESQPEAEIVIETVQVWNVDDQPVVSFSIGDEELRIFVLGDDEPIDPPSPSADSPAADLAPCGAQRARISC